MPDERLKQSLSENILTLLCMDAAHGRLVAGMVTAELFSNDLHQLLARKALEYWRRHNQAPGKAHTADLVAEVIDDPRHPQARTMKNIITSMIVLHDSNINTTYVLDQLRAFIRLQEFNRAVMETAEQLDSRKQLALSDVEEMWGKLLRARHVEFDPGTRLSDYQKMLEWMEKRTVEFSTGVATLNKAGVVPGRAAVVLYLGAKGCLVGNTLIDCPRDLSKYPKGIPIKDLVGKQLLTYSWDLQQDRLVLSRVPRVWRVGKKPVYRVKLSAYPAGQRSVGRKGGGTHKGIYLPPTELVGTFDHPVMLADGQYCGLGELQKGDSLKSLYRRREGSKGYTCISWSDNVERVVNPKSTSENAATFYGLAKSVREHIFVCEAVNGPKPRGAEVHHKDEDDCNQSPSNLEWKNAHRHKSEHTSKRNREGKAGWQAFGIHPRGMLGKTHTEETKRRQSEASSFIAARRQRKSGRFIETPNHKVLSVEYLGMRDVYDMEVEGTANFVANGVFVHNSGKTWFLIDCGKRAFRDNKRVLHLTLEMEEELCKQRYYQALFAVPRSYKYKLDNISRLRRDQRDRFIGVEEERIEADFTLDSEVAGDELEAHLIPFGTKIDNLIIKGIPPRSLTMDRLRSYLDNLELVEKFIPDMIVLDYFGLIRTDPKMRTDESLGHEFEDFRGILAERNMAGVTAQQLTRKGAAAMVAGSTQVAEAWAMVAAADTVLVYSASEAERVRGLGRLAVGHSRESKDHWSSLLVQNYQLGQYAIDSMLLPHNYHDYIARLQERERNEVPEEEEDT